MKIDQPIKGFSVVTPEDRERAAAPPTPAQIERVYLEAKSYERPEAVSGTTYKINPPTVGHALYITINNLVLEDGSLRPIEIFVNTKHVEHFQWVTALMRVISALLRKPGPFLFIIDELQQVFDPQGGYFMGGGQMMPSVVAHIGHVFKKHCEGLGLLEKPAHHAVVTAVLDEKRTIATERGIKGTLCGKCGAMSVVIIDNCATCLECADSKCG